MAKMTRKEAKNIAIRNGISFKLGYHQLRNKHTDLLTELAIKSGYRKPASASGSRTRYFFYNLQRLK